MAANIYTLIYFLHHQSCGLMVTITGPIQYTIFSWVDNCHVFYFFSFPFSGPSRESCKCDTCPSRLLFCPYVILKRHIKIQHNLRYGRFVDFSQLGILDVANVLLIVWRRAIGELSDCGGSSLIRLIALTHC